VADADGEFARQYLADELEVEMPRRPARKSRLQQVHPELQPAADEGDPYHPREPVEPGHTEPYTVEQAERKRRYTARAARDGAGVPAIPTAHRRT
jgi:hypothetical protein